ncbi:MAG TPA: hypothetical protein VIK18_15265 [Pirellulales bacterium]
MSLNATSETAIFERIVLPSDPGLSEQAARSTVAMQFGPEDRKRMQVLADKAKQGKLSPDEEQEVENYERVGHYLAILQSKARVGLKSATDAHS